MHSDFTFPAVEMQGAFAGVDNRCKRALNQITNFRAETGSNRLGSREASVPELIHGGQ